MRTDSTSNLIFQTFHKWSCAGWVWSQDIAELNVFIMNYNLTPSLAFNWILPGQFYAFTDMHGYSFVKKSHSTQTTLSFLTVVQQPHFICKKPIIPDSVACSTSNDWFICLKLSCRHSDCKHWLVFNMPICLSISERLWCNCIWA